MTRLTRAHQIAVLAVISVCSITRTPVLRAQRNLPITQETVLTFVHDFLKAFYPELITKGHRLKLSVLHPADDSWQEISGVYFTVLPENPPDFGFRGYSSEGRPISEDRPDPKIILLDGSVWLPPLEHGSRIQQVVSTGVHTQKLDDLLKLFKSHPEWSNEQLVDVLKKRGARFGPDQKQALLDSVPWEKAEKFLGTLKVTDTWFRLPNEERVGSFEAATLYWDVRADAQFSDGTSGKYAFSFEPFEGKLTLLSRTH
jgi:hypothetical protein